MKESLHVLILEDSSDDADLLLLSLKRAGYDTVHALVEDLDSMTRALDRQPWDIMISDHSMPHFSATLALDLLREKDIDLPVIIVSGTIEPDAAVAAMKAGASDFIMKNDTIRLIPAIERELREARNRRARREAEHHFRQAQKMESVGRLAGGIAHDFNNVLTAILGYSYFLQGSFQPGDARLDDLGEIIKATNRAAALTQQLLAFSRRQVLAPRVLDLNSSVRNIEKMLRRLIGEDIEFATVLETELGRVKVDPGQIEQVLMNLAVNARDAMAGGGKLTLTTSNTEIGEPSAETSLPPGRYVTLAVTDTGTGMDAATQARIFEPFFTTKDAGKGTGLGLSTVHGIVNQSGGGIVVRSSPGHGTTFQIYFPRVDEPAQAPASGAASETSVAGTETVLLVEDEATVREIARRALMGHGYTVLVAASSEEALRTAREHGGGIHLVLTDLILPGIDGVELARRLHALAPGVKTLYMSGYTDRAGTRQNTPELDGAYLQKPFTLAVLMRKVRDMLDLPPTGGV